MKRKLAVPFIFLLLFNVLGLSLAHAGFGITPPYVQNSSLTRNSTYEQQILLVRSDPSVALKATITVDAPEIASWIEVVEGNEILLPQGEQKVPMTVRVRVPEDAEFKQYEGIMRIKTSKADNSVSAGSVSISLGAQVDVRLNVIDREIKDFRVRKITINDLNEGHHVGWLYFPGKIRFGMLIENTGNIAVAPSKVLFKIYDVTGSVLLEEVTHTNKITKIEPYGTEEVMAELPTRLPRGSYLARYQIFNDEEIKQEGEVTLSIVPYGTLQRAGYGFLGLSIPHKISIVLPASTLLIIIISVVYMQLRRRHKTTSRVL